MGAGTIHVHVLYLESLYNTNFTYVHIYCEI